jgi:phosphoglycerate kinase
MLRKMEDLQLQGRSILVRVDYNVPVQGESITDDSRISASLPTIRYLQERGCGITLMSHFGRPAAREASESLARVAAHLSTLLGQNVPLVELGAKRAAPGTIQLLENLRFEKGETSNDEELAARLANLGEVYINDAFGAAHRAHASIDAVTHHFPERGAGFLLQREVHFLRDALEKPARPFIAVLGGSKVSDKLLLIRNLLNKVDQLLIGGAMSYTFLAAAGVSVGKSRVEQDLLAEATSLLERCREQGPELLLPIDHMSAREFKPDAPATITLDRDIPADQMGLDIGPETIQEYMAQIRKARTIVWNGPMGVFEWEAFSTGTISVAEAVAASSALTIIGGGDSVAAIQQANLADRIDHISTGGGAALELLAGLSLPGIAALET